jgi:O-antigen ligase
VLARAQALSRGLVGGSLVAAIAVPHWSFVPYGHGGREFFGIGSRLIGLTPSPNYLGILAVIGVYAEFARARETDRRPNPVWVVLAVGTCLWAQSRTAYLVLALLLMFFAATSARSSALWNRVRVSLLAGLLAGSVLAPLAFAFSSVATNETLGALVTGRFGAWDAAIEAFSDDPLLGFGPGAFGESFWGTYGTPDGQTYANAHNAWLDVLATGGLLGGLSLLTLVVSLLRQPAHTGSTRRVVALGALALVVAQMPLGTPFRLLGLSSNLITMAIVLAVVAAPAGRSTTSTPALRPEEKELS